MSAAIPLVIYDSTSTASFGVIGALPDFCKDGVTASRNCEVFRLMYFPVEEVIELGWVWGSVSLSRELVEARERT